MGLDREGQQHINDLNSRLKSFYEIKDGKTFDVRLELERLKTLEKAFSVIETDGKPRGETFAKYSLLLNNTRERIKFLQSKKTDIEIEHNEEIANIRLLLESFQSLR